MTYSAIETSRDSGAPTELYYFQHGAERWAYTSADEDVTYSSVVYAMLTTERTAVEETPEIGRQAIKITVPRDNPVAALFASGPPSYPVTLTVRRIHRGDTDAVVIWIGRILSAEWGELTATLTGESILTAIKRPGLRRRYGRTCPHTLYSAACGVAQGSYGIRGTLSGVSGSTVQASGLASHADGYWVGGWMQVYRDDRWYRSYVRAHSGASVTLAAPLPVQAGDNYEAYPGCDHTLSLCNSRFSNAINFGGFPWTPLKNPMGGSTIY